MARSLLYGDTILRLHSLQEYFEIALLRPPYSPLSCRLLPQTSSTYCGATHRRNWNGHLPSSGNTSSKKCSLHQMVGWFRLSNPLQAKRLIVEEWRRPLKYYRTLSKSFLLSKPSTIMPHRARFKKSKPRPLLDV